MSRRQELATIASTTTMSVGAPAVALAVVPIVAAAAGAEDSHVAWWREHQEIDLLMNAAVGRAEDAYAAIPEDVRIPRVVTAWYRAEPRELNEDVPIYSETEEQVTTAFIPWMRFAERQGSDAARAEAARRDSLIAELRQKISARDASPAWIEYQRLQVEADRLIERYFGLEHLVAETPARTAEGRRIQISLLRDYIGNGDEVPDKLARSLCASFGIFHAEDAERLAVEA
jgi:hypothetical protein